MRKWNMMVLALLLAAVPAAGMAQDMPQFFGAVYESIGEGLAVGAKMAQHAQENELTLTLDADSARLEEGGAVTLTITAGNPLAHDAAVSFALTLPQHVQADGELTWNAVLPAAQADVQTGELTPSQTVFTRKIVLTPDAERAQSEIQCEMAMGTRFYRAKAPIQLCVSSIAASAYADGTRDGRLSPGDAFSYRVELVNSGDAPKDVTLEMTMPQSVTLADELEPGFEQADHKISGMMHVPAAQGDVPASVEIAFPATISGDALEGDEDAQCLIAPVISLDGENVAAPRIQVCGPKISARLLMQDESLETGEETMLSVVVVNSGLAEADVQLSCVLPQGLTLCDQEDEDKKLIPAGSDDQLPGAGEAIPVQEEMAAPAMQQENRTLVFDVHMDAARQTADGVIAHTQVLEIPVRAEIAKERMTQQTLGAALAWRVDEETAQLGEAVALSVHPQTVLGLTRADWNGVFWAGVLLLVTMVCLYAAVKKERREEDYCFD